jgi:hypothetical protein
VEARPCGYCDEEASVSQRADEEAGVEAAATADGEGSEAAREGGIEVCGGGPFIQGEGEVARGAWDGLRRCGLKVSAALW